MKLRDILLEKTTGNKIPRIAEELERIKSGEMSKMEVLSSGLNLNNVSANSYEKFANTLGVSLDDTISVDELKQAFMKIKVKNPRELAERWLNSKSSFEEEINPNLELINKRFQAKTGQGGVIVSGYDEDDDKFIITTTDSPGSNNKGLTKKVTKEELERNFNTVREWK